MSARILIVDDEQAVIATLRDYFCTLKLDVDCASTLDEARSKLSAARYDAVLTDVQLSRMGDTDGLDLADYVAARCPETPLVVLTAYGSQPHAPLARYDDHATDAILSAAWLRAVADRPELWAPSALTPDLAQTEGWTFGVP